MLFEIIFFGFVTLIGVSTLVLLGTRKVLYAAFALLLIFLGVAALYVFAGADFLAVTQIIIYVGGILVLMLFGIMLTNRPPQSLTIRFSNPFEVKEQTDMQPKTNMRNAGVGIIAGLGLFDILIYAIQQVASSGGGWMKAMPSPKKVIEKSTVQGLGIQLMTEYVLVFEVIAVLLMVALMGTLLIAGKNQHKSI